MYKTVANRHIFNSAVKNHGKAHTLTVEQTGNTTLYKEPTGRIVAKHYVYQKSEQLCLLDELLPKSKDMRVKSPV